jgi:serine kinase of HPr protein (carbohydrate metabolism regulator)
MTNIHATCVTLNNKGILLLGKSGSGKSDLALRLIEQTGATLVSDDRTELCIKNNKITAYYIDELKGMLEVRGVGIIKKKYQTETVVLLAVELVDELKKIERLPKKEYWEFNKIKIQKIKIYPFESSAPFKVKAACDEIGEAS